MLCFIVSKWNNQFTHSPGGGGGWFNILWQIECTVMSHSYYIYTYGVYDMSQPKIVPLFFSLIFTIITVML